jgi:ammonium transporter, Amt family
MADLWLVLLGVGALTARLGLALYLTGLSRAKNAASAALRTAADLCVAVLAFWAVGNAVLSSHFSFSPVSFFYAAIFLFATGAALGGTLERARFFPTLAASAVLAGLVVPLAARWAWSGWLGKMGFIDAAGASVIHLCGGMCAAAGAFMVGPRGGKYNRDGSTNMIPGHNVPWVVAGALAMAVGFLPQMIGCAILHDGQPALAAADGLLAAAAGGMAGLLLGWVRYAATDAHFLIVGMLGGLVSVSAGAGRMEPWEAVAVGGAAGLLISQATVWIDLKFRIDDPGSSIAIHGVGGLWGLLAMGISAGGNPLRQLAIQTLGAAAVGALALAVSMLVFGAMRKQLRLGEADELDGSDLAEHDLNAYPDFQQTTIKSYHLRET